MISGARGQTEYDVIVAGAGPTGICAAIAAGRTGARTLLVERFPFPGGEAVTALNLHGWHDNSEEHIIRGIESGRVPRSTRHDRYRTKEMREPAVKAGSLA
jgi:flavin-dependent dehydrogenase